MKKSLIIVCLILIGYTGADAQSGLRLGVNGGLPTGDVEEITNFQAGADIAYRVSVLPLLDVGPLIGYSRFFLEETDMGLDDIEFLPIAASGRVNFALLLVGLDLGYAVGLNEGNDGGFYYRPQIGVKLGPIGLIGSYSGISRDGGSVNSVNLGIEFGL